VGKGFRKSNMKIRRIFFEISSNMCELVIYGILSHILRNFYIWSFYVFTVIKIYITDYFMVVEKIYIMKRLPTFVF